MAGRRKGGSPFKTLLEGIVTAFLIGIMLVVLAVTPAWDAIIDATGVGHHVDVSSLFHKDPVRPDRQDPSCALAEPPCQEAERKSPASAPKEALPDAEKRNPPPIITGTHGPVNSREGRR